MGHRAAGAPPRAWRAGAAGFLVKGIEPEDFLHAMWAAAHGDAIADFGRA